MRGKIHMSKRKRGLRGLKGLGGETMQAVVPPAVGSILTLGVTMGLRAYLQPTPGTTAAVVYKWAPAVGAGAGMLGAGAMYFLGGSKRKGKHAAMAAGLTAVIVGASLLGLERLNAAKAGALSALSTNGSLPSNGTGMVVPQYPNGMGAIVMERLGGNNQQQGADIRLQGVVDQGAFGTRTYG